MKPTPQSCKTDVTSSADLTLKNDYMNWEKINTANLPEGEVLAANFKAGTYGYTEKLLGYLHMDGDVICCENDNEVLENCTHYIDINKHDIKEVD